MIFFTDLYVMKSLLLSSLRFLCRLLSELHRVKVMQLLLKPVKYFHSNHDHMTKVFLRAFSFTFDLLMICSHFLYNLKVLKHIKKTMTYGYCILDSLMVTFNRIVISFWIQLSETVYTEHCTDNIAAAHTLYDY